MNALIRIHIFLLFLAGAIIFLPACGSKGSVKQKPNETVLNPEQTPLALTPGAGSTNPGTYVEKIHRSKGPKSKTTISTTPVATTESAAASVNTPETAPKQTPAVETTLPVKKNGGFHWLLWLLVLIVIGGIVWYFLSKNREHNDQTGQPTPPMGGLSPVSGFTAVKDHIEDEAETKPSIWFKKIF